MPHCTQLIRYSRYTGIRYSRYTGIRCHRYTAPSSSAIRSTVTGQERPKLITTVDADYQTGGSGNLEVTHTKCGPENSSFQVN